MCTWPNTPKSTTIKVTIPSITQVKLKEKPFQIVPDLLPSWEHDTRRVLLSVVNMNSYYPAKHRWSLCLSPTTAEHRNRRDAILIILQRTRASLLRFTVVWLWWNDYIWDGNHLRIWQRLPLQPGLQWQVFGPKHSPPFKHFCRQTAGGTETNRETRLKPAAHIIKNQA